MLIETIALTLTTISFGLTVAIYYIDGPDLRYRLEIDKQNKTNKTQ